MALQATKQHRSSFFFESLILKKFKIDDLNCLCVCVASNISENSEAIAIIFDMVTVSVTIMHHVLTILTLTINQGHTDFNHENNKCSITLEIEPIRSCSSNALPFFCEDSPTEGLYSLFSVR